MITNGLQDFAQELSGYFKEPKKFGLYAGLIKKNGQQKVREVFSEFRDLMHRRADIKNPARYFIKMFKRNV